MKPTTKSIMKSIMKRVAEFFYILFRTMFHIASWLVLVVAMVGIATQILALDMDEVIGKVTELLFAGVGFVNDLLEIDAAPIVNSGLDLVADIWAFAQESGMLVLILSFVAMYGCRFAFDFLNKTKPLYLGVVELTAEITAWALKCLVAYMGLCVLCYGICWLQEPEILSTFADVEAVLDFLLNSVLTPLTFAGCAAVVCLICTGVSHKLAEN